MLRSALRRTVGHEMKCLRVVCTGLLALVFSACAVVYVESPVGEDPVKLDAEEWNGTWLHAEGAVTVKVLDSEDGALGLAWVDSEGEQLVPKSAAVHLRLAGGRVLVSWKEEDAAEPGYLWGILSRRDEQVVVLAPDADKFRVLVEQQKLPGHVENGDIYLGRLGPEHLDIILSDQEGFLFDWEEPLVLTRVAR